MAIYGGRGAWRWPWLIDGGGGIYGALVVHGGGGGGIYGALVVHSGGGGECAWCMVVEAVVVAHCM